MNPKYSILLCNQKRTAYESYIRQWLKKGIKVFWFGCSFDVMAIKKDFKKYADALMLQTFEINISLQAIVVDGENSIGVIPVLEKACPKFNAAQYLVEHCIENKNIVVQASAGTGKTTVMIDRILFLIHTVPNLKLSDIFMITFTNDAANQMNIRLQNALIQRYELTGQPYYLRWLEEQSEMHISTIHSFAYWMLKQYGIYKGFTKDLSIQSFQYEVKELIKDILESHTHEGESLYSQLGMNLYQAETIIVKFWNEFTRKGFSHDEMLKLDWGEPANADSASFHNIVSNVINELDEKYYNIKVHNNAVGLNDIMRDLEEVLLSKNLPTPDFSLRYLFIDEFQDSDFSQIKVAAILASIHKASLFVVGDIKQSIYRFRGATETAFQEFQSELKKIGLPQAEKFELVNNYRTAPNVLNGLDKFFKCWAKNGRLDYHKSVIPFHEELGEFKIVAARGKKAEAENQMITCFREALENLDQKLQEKEETEKSRVVILTRTNRELTTLGTLLKENSIPAQIRREGSFYASEAVRDFYAMISSYLFADDPKYLFCYLLTPYAGNNVRMDIQAMEELNGDKAELQRYLHKFINNTDWEFFFKEFRLQPVMSVIKKIKDHTPVVENYIADLKKRYLDLGWDKETAETQILIQARQYQANLEKLMEVLQHRLKNGKVSLRDVYSFLQLNIATNREEQEAAVFSNDNHKSLLCMTVHRAKGLEFDTVILPFTSREFLMISATELLIDVEEQKIGWNVIEKRTGRRSHNNYYSSAKRKDNINAVSEEARILYVAMTRTIRRLICFVYPPTKGDSWTNMFHEAEE